MKKLLILCLLAMLSIPLIYAQCTDIDGGVTCNNQFYNDYCESTSMGGQYANIRICKNVTYQDCASLVGVNRVLCPYDCKDGACIQQISVISPNGGETFSDNQIISIKTKIFSNKIGSIRIILVEEFSGSVYEVGTVYNISMSAINYYYYVDLDLAKLKSMGAKIPPEGAYRARVHWDSDDQTEKWFDSSHGYFKIVYTQQTCTDTDGGKDYYTKAQVSGYLNGQQYTWTDSCCTLSSSGTACTNTESPSNYLQEYICIGFNPTTDVYKCPNGCKDGACIQQATCTDSDGGKNYYVKGNVRGAWPGNTNLETETDNCCTNCYNKIPTPVSSSDTLVEVYCNEQNYIALEIYGCPNGCKDGACIQQVTCTDSDGGKNYYVKGITKGVDSQGNSITEEDNCGFTVSVSNEKNYDYVNEFYCSGSVVYGSQYNCPYGCRDGACVSKEGGCMDSDGGEDYYTKGYVTTLNGTFNDECYSDGIKLFEYSCFNNDQKRTDYNCPYGCRDGACIQFDHCTNGVQDNDETGIDCGGSCSPCAEVCNKDGVCDLKQEENSDNCPEDCYCGDGVCDSLENYKDCPEDCGYCAPEWECHLEPATCPEEGIQNKVCIDIKCGTEDKRVEVLKCVPGTCSGCLSEGTCYPVTTRMLLGEIPNYCDVTKTFAKQKDLGAPCQNNYECLSNECSDGECISIKKQLEETRSLLQKILDWIKNIF